MKQSLIPTNYDEWRHCITVECGLKLTPEYIASRIEALNNNADHYTQQYVKSYGQAQLEQTLAWFKQAQQTENK
ncbi:hypothetical protein HR060_14895 [Catenovulum sp. SM1970]|uniref:hypothetical protein n=1 Tax=Marinifaba aquimaris TaxID=2741323 RepID=UPI0015736CE2|nr:hypothetical protein [Marinifaba aquimaris]NTS78139.1 hypothetical protein [Marinifaba aquimaris]